MDICSNSEFIRDLINQHKYQEAIDYCRKYVESHPENIDVFIYLGLSLLLNGDETSAEAAWLTPIVGGEIEIVDNYHKKLVEVLKTQASQDESLKDISHELMIRTYIQIFEPRLLNNVFRLCLISLEQNHFSWKNSEFISLNDLFSETNPSFINYDLLQKLISYLLEKFPEEPETLTFLHTSTRYLPKLPTLLESLRRLIRQVGFAQVRYFDALPYAELGHSLFPNDSSILTDLSVLYRRTYQYQEAIDASYKLIALQNDLPHKLFANNVLLESLVAAGGHEEQTKLVFHHQKELILELLKAYPLNLSRSQTRCLYILQMSPAFLLDEPQVEKKIYNQLMSLCEANVRIYAQKYYNNCKKTIDQRSLSKKTFLTKPLRVGFMSDHLRRHAIGWLSWALYQYGDRSKIQINTYYVGNLLKVSDDWQQWYIQKSDDYFFASLNSYDLAYKISQDNIDILVDLDSITYDINCEVLSLRPSPIQLSWLGFDASGIPSVDYYFADPYVLPSNSQSYYSEKIWRFPDTYLAIDGFVTTNPTVRRCDFDIPTNGTIFLSNQRAAKRNRRMTQLHMQVIKNVPNSYLLIKVLGLKSSLKSWFIEIAESEGVSVDQLKFLPIYPTDEEYRANLSIADVVLDTYPYNGATTTLETLWMEVPVVTRVGQQFAARNSYTFLKNAGVEEGIAWTDEEYVEWGIRLGQDEELRKSVSWKLKQAKKFSPLWNGRKFAQDMEAAFQAMWHHYVTGEMILPPGHRLG